jgi:hypothetical protein
MGNIQRKSIAFKGVGKGKNVERFCFRSIEKMYAFILEIMKYFPTTFLSFICRAERETPFPN